MSTPSGTQLARLDQFRDRWSSLSDEKILDMQEMLSPQELQQFELFAGFDEKKLKKICPDIAVVRWDAQAVLFEEGSYIDLAFYVVEGEVELSINKMAPAAPQAIFDPTRTVLLPGPPEQKKAEATSADNKKGPAGPATLLQTRLLRPPDKKAARKPLLTALDFDISAGEKLVLSAGEIFGELGAMSGWPQSVTAVTRTPCLLVQLRLPALRGLRQNKDLKARLDALYRERSLASQLQATPMFQDMPPALVEKIRQEAELLSCEPGDRPVTHGGAVDGLYLVRSGFLQLSQPFSDGDLTVTYLSKGMTLGEVELVAAELPTWQVNATSVEYCELVKIPEPLLREVLTTVPALAERFWTSAVARLKEIGRSRRNLDLAEFTHEAMESGLIQGNSILAIDLDVCTRCDDCVRACASTHGGRPRFVREGTKYQNLLIAKSCYHCRDPVCLVGCPTGSIRRAGDDFVVEIEDDICIGCKSCARNCPYDSIIMSDTGETWPETVIPAGLKNKPRLLASKCDLCRDRGHDPACVTNCPHGCAQRVGSLEAFEGLLRRR